MNEAIRDVMQALAAMSDLERYKTPWSRSECSYATDGKMMIRTTRLNEFPDRAANDGASVTGDELALAPTGPTWYDVPSDLPAAPGPCQKCHGVQSVKCEACDGDGRVEWEFEYNGRTYDMDADCPVCGGEGAEECSRCAGTGVLPEPPVEIGPALIRAGYLRLMARLPGCRLAPVDGWSVVVFRFIGGAGAVMPVRR